MESVFILAALVTIVTGTITNIEYLEHKQKK